MKNRPFLIRATGKIVRSFAVAILGMILLGALLLGQATTSHPVIPEKDCAGVLCSSTQ